MKMSPSETGNPRKTPKRNRLIRLIKSMNRVLKMSFAAMKLVGDVIE
jgi:hypothetical protein